MHTPHQIAGTLYAAEGHGEATMLFARPERTSGSWVATSFSRLAEGALWFDTPWKAYRVSWAQADALRAA